MPNIIQTKHGVYDVDTIFGCYSYLIRECGLSGDRCAMVNKLYVMANIAEIGAEVTRPDGEAAKTALAHLMASVSLDIVKDPQGAYGNETAMHVAAVLKLMGVEG